MTMENGGGEQSIRSDTSGIGGSTPPSASQQPQQQQQQQEDLMNAAELSPSISRSEGIAATANSVSATTNQNGSNSSTVSAMIDASDYRSLPEAATYHTLNGRMSPSSYHHHHHQAVSANSYATLTPLQPLPPISTVSDKFAAGHGASPPNMSGSGFSLMSNTMVDMNTSAAYARYDVKPQLSNMMGMSANVMMASNGYAAHQTPQALGPSPYSTAAAYGQHNGIMSPKPEPKMMSPNSVYEYSRAGIGSPTSSSRMHSPNTSMMHLNGLHGSTPSPHAAHSPMSPVRERGALDGKHDMEEINTKELAQKISSELKRYSIPQAVFAQRVLCRSQGTLSDLLRNPKPWSKLKSGRETFRRMWKWLQEPEFQRMSALRLAVL
ncbi:DgyrCDS13633 [Dimorphilus gyrociliatus]|uniref:DgyrCDS13633 n=1 Tax=Dimorphilus gyrociliatus TaxID=2664684 RepID=A0A7I8WB91_9ANNE|nr:DgyrCDS13633 [Dimorphilus gyrociliatus]